MSGDTARREHAGKQRYAFPTAGAVAVARLPALKACGLSGAKAESLRGIARRTEAGEVSFEKLAGLASAEAIRWLTDLPGIGTWSASVLLWRSLRRLDVFPPGDVGVARGRGPCCACRRDAHSSESSAASATGADTSTTTRSAARCSAEG